MCLAGDHSSERWRKGLSCPQDQGKKIIPLPTPIPRAAPGEQWEGRVLLILLPMIVQFRAHTSRKKTQHMTLSTDQIGSEVGMVSGWSERLWSQRDMGWNLGCATYYQRNLWQVLYISLSLSFVLFFFLILH